MALDGRRLEHVFASVTRVESGAKGLPDDPRARDAIDHEPDAADFADAHEAVGVLDRWAWFEDPQADDWWVGDALEEHASDVVAVNENDAADRRPWASAEFLEHALPGPGLAQLLELVAPGDLDDAALVESTAAWERLSAWAHLGAALAAGELSRRASMNPRWVRPAPAKECVAGDELAMRLGWSRPAANRLVRDGRALGAQLLPLADAVRAGLLDTSKLRVLADRLHDRAYQLSWPVLDQVLPEAPLRTPTQLAADVDRALLALDPADAAVRLPKALAARHVCHPRRLPDGMAGLWAVLPADDAARIDATLEATARAARAVGDPRTLDQLRADTLTGLATGDALLAGAIAGGESYAADEVGDLDVSRGEGGPPVGRPAPGIRVPKIRIDVTVALSTLMGLDDLPGELAGLGPIPAEQVRAVAAGGIWRRLVTDPLTGAVLDVGRTRYRPPAGLAEHVLARDGSCAAPGCSVASHRCDLDHTTEYYGSPANGSPAPGTTSNDNLGPLSNRCHRLKTDGGFVLRQVEPGVFEWWTPGGMAYRVTPGQHGRTEKLDTRRSRYPEEPPF